MSIDFHEIRDLGRGRQQRALENEFSAARLAKGQEQLKIRSPDGKCIAFGPIRGLAHDHQQRCLESAFGSLAANGRLEILLEAASPGPARSHPSTPPAVASDGV